MIRQLINLTGCLWLVLIACGEELGSHAAVDEDSPKSKYAVISVRDDPSITAPLRKIDTVVQEGSDARNRFTMHRIFRTDARHERGSLILVPSLLNNVREYLINEHGDPMQSLIAHLALETYEVWSFSSRTSNFGPNACGSGSVDCSIIKGWDLQVWLNDVDYIRQQATKGSKKPAIGGLSLGGMLGTAAINQNPSGYSGLLLWDAMLYSKDPVITALNANNCAGLRGTIDAGVYYDEGLANLIHMQAEAGEAATIQFFGVPQPALGTPNFIQIVANAGLTHYQYASFARVYPFIVAADNIVSFPLLRDLNCANSGERTYTSELHKYKGPVFAIKGGLGFGPYMNDTINLMQSRNVRVQDTPEFGHLDHLLVPNHADYVERPIVEWLNEVVFANRD